MNKNKKNILTIAVFITIFVSTIAALNMNVEARIIEEPPIIEDPPITTHTFIVQGHVRTTSGAPISGAKVTVTYGDIINKYDYTDANGYYYIYIVTSLYKTCSIKAVKSGFYTQTKSVYSKGVNTIDFSLTALPPPPDPEFYTIVGSIWGSMSSLYFFANSITIKTIMHDGYADVYVYIRVNNGWGYITLDNANWVEQSSSKKLRRSDGTIVDLTETIDRVGVVDLFYDTPFDFGKSVVMLDYHFRLGYEDANSFSITCTALTQQNINNIVGLQEKNLRGDADVEVTVLDVSLLGLYLAQIWNYEAELNFGPTEAQICRLFTEWLLNILGIISFDQHPSPTFVYHRI